LANTTHEPAAAPLLADCFAIACRAMDDMVLLAHIREQHKLSMQSYGRPHMTEELQELGFDVSHPLPAADCTITERAVLAG